MSPRKTATRYFWPTIRFCSFLWRVYFKIFHACRIRGLNNIPPEGPLLLAPNHVSFYDAQLVGMSVRRRVTYLILKKYADVPLIGWFICQNGGFPIASGNDRHAYRGMLKTLEKGHCLIIFPEGSRSHTGELEPLQSGPARMALTTGAQITPVTLVGAYAAWPRSRRLPALFKPIVVKYYPPIQCEKIEDKAQLKKRVQEINARLEKIYRRRQGAWKRLWRRKRQREKSKSEFRNPNEPKVR